MILKPIQMLYEGLSDLKNILYNYNILKTLQLQVPVISVGNLSVGGTGKTPCVCLLAESLLEKKLFKNIGIISRSYKTALKTPKKVDLKLPQAARLFGDEPCLLQKKLPQCSVWSGPKKYITAQAALAAEPIELIIIDDGFSHRKLERQFDLVLLDVTAPLSDYETLPAGRLRESLGQLHRAHALVLTKTNLARPDQTETLLELVLNQKKVLRKNIYMAEMESDIGSLVPGVDELFVFCGLAQPASLQTSLRQLGFKIQKLKSFSDHHNYSVDELDQIYREYSVDKDKNPKLKLVTTAKDAIKFLHHSLQNDLNIIDYRMKILDNKEGSLLEKISHCL